jgi:DNA-binding transcriptional LysR family regulator
MLDALSLDQLRAFIAAAEEGSFSAAGRKLSRAQSAVSEIIAALEAEMGVKLFDRSARLPRLTPQGEVLLADARGIAAAVDGMKARARGMAQGLEPELSVVVDVMFPIPDLAMMARQFREQFPGTPLRLFVEALGAAYEPVLDGRASLAIVGSLPIIPDGFRAEPLGSVAMVIVAAADHPLARKKGAIARAELARHVQLVLTDRSTLSKGREFGVMSSNTWRLADLFAKHEFLLKGLGWGGMPLHVVEGDLKAGRLKTLSIADLPRSGLKLDMSAAYPAAAPPGPAGRWLVDRAKRCAEEVPKHASTAKGSRSR